MDSPLGVHRAICHPDRKHRARGLCGSCYWKSRPKARAVNRRRHTLKQYELTVEQYNDLLAQQNFCCAICKKPIDHNLVVDHDHSCCPESKRSCGKCIRGLLCSSCNQGIGYLKDDPNLLRAALDYLESSKRSVI